MRGINQVILLGFLGKDPEYRQLDSGSELTTFSLAVDETYRQNGQDVPKTSWHNIVVWGTMAPHCANYLSKGSQVLVMGKIAYEQYEQEGVKKTATKIIAQTVRFLDRKQNHKESNQESETTASPEAILFPNDNDDLPF